jgi:hypothetical protein
MRKDLLLQSIGEAAAQHRTPSISPTSLQSKKTTWFLISLNHWGMVGVGLRARKGKIKFGLKKEYFYTFKL